jgi:shikimate kinase / 3-dehydroquinate synthase
VREIEAPAAAQLGEIVFECTRFKVEVVAADERDSGRRAILNFGHTVGHALEAATGYGRYRHGEAVGLGMLAALRISEADQLAEQLRTMLDRVGLPTRIDPPVETDAILEALQRDKKRDADGIRFVLLSQPGEPQEGERVEPGRVRDSIEELLG